MSVVVSLLGINTGPLSSYNDELHELLASSMNLDMSKIIITTNCVEVASSPEIITPLPSTTESPQKMSQEILELQSQMKEIKRQVNMYREKNTVLDVERKVMKDLVESSKRQQEQEERRWAFERDNLTFQIETLNQTKFDLRKEIEKLKLQNSLGAATIISNINQSKNNSSPTTTSTKNSNSNHKSNNNNSPRNSRKNSKKSRTRTPSPRESMSPDRESTISNLSTSSIQDTPPKKKKRKAKADQRRSKSDSKASNRKRNAHTTHGEEEIREGSPPFIIMNHESEPEGSPPPTPKKTTKIMYGAYTAPTSHQKRRPEMKSRSPIRQRAETFDETVSLDAVVQTKRRRYSEELFSVDFLTGNKLEDAISNEIIAPARNDPTNKKKTAKPVEIESSRSRELLLNPFGEHYNENDAKYAFDLFDEKGSGRITYRDFERVIKHLGLPFNGRQLKQIFSSIDINKKRCIEFEEFAFSLKNLNATSKGLWTAIMSRSQLSAPVRSEDLPLDVVKKALDGRKADWTERVHALHCLSRRLCVSCNASKFNRLMRVVKLPLLDQLKDGRSIVVRETCIIVAKIATSQKGNFTKYSPQILQCLFQLMRMTIFVMSVSSLQASRTIVRVVPDNKKLEILQTILTGATKNTHKETRLHCFELLLILIQNGRPKRKNWWSSVHQALKVGMLDPSVNVRNIAYEATALCEIIHPGSVSNLLKGLGTASLRRYEKVLIDQKRDRATKRDPGFE